MSAKTRKLKKALGQAHEAFMRARMEGHKETNMKKTTKKTTTKLRPVIVTTAHRGVFFGYAKDIDGEVIALKKARLCVYWSSDVKGFMGLAAGGPTKSCRVGPAADIKLRNITAVLDVTPAAVKAWESGPWS